MIWRYSKPSSLWCAGVTIFCEMSAPFSFWVEVEDNGSSNLLAKQQVSF
jgi:hypothetical protein